MKLLLYVADEFKTLEGGKTLAVGLFTDRVVVLNVPRDAPSPTAELPYGIPLGLLACLIDVPKTELAGSATIQPPSGATVMRVPSVLVKPATVGGSANVVFRLDPFLMTGEGIYTLALELEGESLSETFELRVKRTDDPAAKVAFMQQIEQPERQTGA